MATRHSKTYYKKQKALEDREKELRKDLDFESENSEKAVFTFLKNAGIVLAGLGVGYLIYRAVTSNKRKEDEEKKEEVNVRVKSNPVKSITSRILDSMVYFGIQALVASLKKDKGTSGESDVH